MKTLLSTLLLACIVTINSHAQQAYFYVSSGSDDIAGTVSLCELNQKDSSIKKVASFVDNEGSNYFTLSNNGKFLYAVSWENLRQQGKQESVTAFRIDKETHQLTLLNKQAINGSGGVYVDTTPDDKFIAVSYYTSGNVVILPLNEDGSIAAESANIRHKGTGRNKVRQEAPHVHYGSFSANSKYLHLADLGTNKIMNYIFNNQIVQLIPNPEQPFVEASPGAGPRHMVFHPENQFAYVISELTSTITAYAYNAKKGSLKLLEEKSLLQSDYKGDAYGSAIRIHPNGDFLYGSVRGYNAIVGFEIQDNGTLKEIVQHRGDI